MKTKHHRAITPPSIPTSNDQVAKSLATLAVTHEKIFRLQQSQQIYERNVRRPANRSARRGSSGGTRKKKDPASRRGSAGKEAAVRPLSVKTSQSQDADRELVRDVNEESHRRHHVSPISDAVLSQLLAVRRKKPPPAANVHVETDLFWDHGYKNSEISTHHDSYLESPLTIDEDHPKNEHHLRWIDNHHFPDIAAKYSAEYAAVMARAGFYRKLRNGAPARAFGKRQGARYVHVEADVWDYGYQDRFRTTHKTDFHSFARLPSEHHPEEHQPVTVIHLANGTRMAPNGTLIMRRKHFEDTIHCDSENVWNYGHN
ncbi:hypothetical protein HK102_003861, partial [Quaeritorhiza haematococci]